MARSSNPIKHYASAVYDFAVDGGAINTLYPSQTTVIPANAIMVDVTIETLTTHASSGSNTLKVIACGKELTGSIALADRQAGDVYTTILPKRGHTTEREIGVIIGAATLTAGKSIITVGYYTSTYQP
tara:strand:- start:165 stop:548 length:384 start_codon:yes stop_codon:yes gene_type:complete